jgi:hypothetical protein
MTVCEGEVDVTEKGRREGSRMGGGEEGGMKERG